MSGKRKQVVLSLNQKWEVIKQLDGGDSIGKVASDLGIGKLLLGIGGEINRKLKSGYLNGIQINKRLDN